MTWTYDSTDLSTNLAKVRVGLDDDTNDQLLTDEEINYILGLTSSIAQARVRSIETILAKIARRIDRNQSGVSASRAQMTQHYRDLLKIEKSRALSGNLNAYGGGLSQSRIDSAIEDSDFPQPEFRVDMGENSTDPSWEKNQT